MTADEQHAGIDATSRVRAPQQQRSRDTLERIYSAAAELFATKGPQATSVQDIVSAAGCSTGSFYQRFPNRDALAAAVFERFEQATIADIERLFEKEVRSATSLQEAVTAILDWVFDLYARQAGLLRALLLLTDVYPFTRAGGMRVIGAAAQHLAVTLAHWQAEMTHRDPVVAAQMTVRMSVGLLDSYLLLGTASAETYGVPLDILRAELERAILGYLGARQR